MPDETLALWRNTGDTAAETSPGSVEQQTRPWSLWRYALALVLLAAMIESVFASQIFERRKAGGMTALEQLNAYLRRMELRLRLFAASRGTALVAGLALVLTVLLVWISNRYAFADARGPPFAHFAVSGFSGGGIVRVGYSAIEAEPAPCHAIGRAAHRWVRRTSAYGQRSGRTQRIHLRNWWLKTHCASRASTSRRN